MKFQVFLTVADHDANGFVHLGQWYFKTKIAAQKFIDLIDDNVTDDEEADYQTANFWFILDLWAGNYTIGGGKRRINLQTAMRLAPEQVGEWVKTRPDPNELFFTDSYNNPPMLGDASRISAAYRAQKGE